MYKIEFAKAAVKELEHIYSADKKLYQRLTTAIESLSKNPFLGKALKGPFKGDYSFRVGNYRIIYTVFKSKLLVVIIDLGHRRDIYR